MTRAADHPIAPMFTERWSPRAFDSSPIAKQTLLSLFEAARWAPSAFNYQPWRFVWAMRDDAAWTDFLDLLLPMNALWAQSASALVFLLSDTHVQIPGSDDLQKATTASFDAGGAWIQLALQAHLMGLHCHAMAGFDRQLASERTGANGRYKVEVAIAIGRIGLRDQLPEALQVREFASPRKSVDEIAFHGRLGN